MAESELVSIIIPTYYRNEWVTGAIESALDQTYDPVEVLVVDDSGERHAESAVDDYDVRYLAHDQNEGGNPARNTGIEAARGEYIQFLDDDDRLDPRKLEKQVPLLQSDPSVDIIYCGIEQEDGVTVYPDSDGYGNVLTKALRFDLHPCQTTTMLFDGDFLRGLAPLANREAGDDLGLKIRAANETNFQYVDEILVEKGDTEHHRADKVGFSDEVQNIIREFDSLYDRVDDSVRREALVEVHAGRGYRLMQQRLWSFRAILSFAKALYYQRKFSPKLLGSLVSSLFGRPGFRFAQRVYSS